MQAQSILALAVVVTVLVGGTAGKVSNPADINNDGAVNWLDFAILADNWLWTAPPEGMVLIAGGEFEMGDHYDAGYVDEKPVHTVYVDSFYMSTCEITNQQYCDFLNAAQVKIISGTVYASSDNGNIYPYFFTHSGDSYSQITYSGSTFSVGSRDGYSMAEHPVVKVSWYGAAAYCNWCSEQAGHESCYNLYTWDCDFSKNGYRLPTEAEWEYAARGGCHEPYYKYPWCSNTIDCSKANYCPEDADFCNPLGLSSFPYTTPVGYYAANGYGLYDMAGNVWEWCNDRYSWDYYDVSPYDNPTGLETMSYRVLRGGGWNGDAFYSRVARRDWYLPEYRFYNFGFRVVVGLD